MQHKVLILSLDNQPQFLGGIKRVCSMLADCWTEHNHASATFLTFCTSELRKTSIGLAAQKFFPNPYNYAASENVDYLINTVTNEDFTILLNPHVEDNALNELIKKVRSHIQIPMIGALHFAPTHTSDIVRQSFFNKYKLGRKPVQWGKDFALWLKYHSLGARKIALQERKQHMEAAALYDTFVLLSQQFIPNFPVKGSKIVGINNPAPCLPAEYVDFSKKEKSVVWCGRMDINGAKRCDRILKIWQKVSKVCPDWHLYILGSGNEDYVKKLISLHHISNVTVTGFCSPFEYYDKASILCATSTIEGWGMVLVEAQSRGCVPMAFDSYASVHDIITDNDNGILVSPFNLQEYSVKLIELMQNDDKRKRLAVNSLETVKRFKVDSIAAEWINLFDSLSRL